MNQEVTRLLEGMQRGEQRCVDQLFTLLYQDLHSMATALIRREPVSADVEPSALVHDLYLRLFGKNGSRRAIMFNDYRHFIRVARRILWRTLIDYGRKRQRRREKIDRARDATLHSAGEYDPDHVDVLIALEEAVLRLESRDSRKAAIIRMRFSCGMTFPEIAQELDLSQRQVERDWRTARRYLKQWIVDS